MSDPEVDYLNELVGRIRLLVRVIGDDEELVQGLRSIIDERDRLRGALHEVHSHLGPPHPLGWEVGGVGVPALVKEAMLERDRLQGLLDAREDERGRLLTELHRLRGELGSERPARRSFMVAATNFGNALEDVRADNARLRAVVKAACSELERSGYGSISVVVERLIHQLDLSYPLDVNGEDA